MNSLVLFLRAESAPREARTLRYAHIRANELNSLIQFGQASRVNVDGNVVSVVTDPHFADDIYLDFNRVITRQTFLTAGLSVSFPGSGVDDVIGERADPWTGGFFDVVVNF